MSTSGNTTNGFGKKRWEGGARSGVGQHRNPPIDQQQRQLDALKALCRARGIEQSSSTRWTARSRALGPAAADS
jgi:hypothetical protein